MDIFAHGLWAAAVYKVANGLNTKKNNGKLFSLKLAAFWGVFPDLFAFTHVFVVLIGGRLFGLDVPDFGPPQTSEPPHNGYWIFSLAQSLYNLSHSLVIFIFVFCLIWFLWRRPPYIILGWLLHILIDIPTHSYEFYPTPVLWPISEWKFRYGFSWGESWFMILNYSTLIFVYGFFFVRFLLRRYQKHV